MPIAEFVMEKGEYIYYVDGENLLRVDKQLEYRTVVLTANGPIRQFFFGADDTLYYTAETSDDGYHTITLYRYQAKKSVKITDDLDYIYRIDSKSIYIFVTYATEWGYGWIFNTKINIFDLNT